MRNKIQHGVKSSRKDSAKDNDFKAQRKIFYNYLKRHTATCSMVAKATGLEQKNLCRYKRYYEKKDLLWEVECKLCKDTKHRAWYLTTNYEVYLKSKNAK